MQKARSALFTLHNLGQAYGRRPSDIAGIEDEWAAYQFDAAALSLGRTVENAIRENTGLKKNQRRPVEQVVKEILAGTVEAGRTGSFRNPRPFVGRKMKIPESGVW